MNFVRLIACLWLMCAPPQAFSIAPDPTPRHALEIQALTDPNGVLQAIPALVARASADRDFTNVALLQLARANACRNLADWPCQSDAGLAAIQAAKQANMPILQTRGKIAVARADILLQDFARAEDALADAQLLLKNHPFPLLSAEVMLAYSSLSEGIGKLDLTVSYADRGLVALQNVDAAAPTQARLLRNRAGALTKLRNFDRARADLSEARGLLVHMNDPKLTAEISLELARVAYMQKDVAAQVENGRAIMQLATRLRNSQLSGLGNEVLGLAAESAGDQELAATHLRIAVSEFHALKLRRDELRALRALLQNIAATSQSAAGQVSDMTDLVTRFLALQSELDIIERAHAADDFEAGLIYAEQQLQVERLSAKTQEEALRNVQLQQRNHTALGMLILACVMLAAVTALFVWLRRTHLRLRAALLSVRESEASFRELSETAQDIVVRMAPDGKREYISPSVKTLLGYEPAELIGGNWDLVHPNEKDELKDAITRVFSTGKALSISYRVLHKQGHYVWLESLARRVPSSLSPGNFDIVYAARDITARIHAELALAASEQRLKSVADNIPALISYVDAELKYQFVNAYTREIFGENSQHAIGRTIMEMRGAEVFNEIEPHAQAALAGNAVSFEGSLSVSGRRYYYQSRFVPDVSADGKVLGFYSVTFDITDRKLAELELDRLARFDGLTGLANRRHFDERMSLALARARRNQTGILLIYIDIDHFKAINDSLGHLAGDGVIREFAARLQASAREEDLVARTGGDEFMVLIEDASSADPAIQITQRIQNLLLRAISLAEHERIITVSVGIAFMQAPRDAAHVIEAADLALYAAKRNGRNNYQLAS